MKVLKKFLVIITIIAYSSSLLADRIYLNNGTVIEGKVIDQSKTKVQIDVKGKLTTIEKDNIKRIEYDLTLNPQEPEKKPIRKMEQAQQKKIPPPQKKESLIEDKNLEYIFIGVLVGLGVGFVLTKFSIYNPKSYHAIKPSFYFKKNDARFTSTALGIVSFALIPYMIQKSSLNKNIQNPTMYDLYVNNIENSQNNINFYHPDFNSYPIFAYKKEF